MVSLSRKFTSQAMYRAGLTLRSSLPYNVNVFTSDDLCVKCSLLYKGTLERKGNLSFSIYTAATTTLHILKIDDGQQLCRYQGTYNEYSNYAMDIKATSKVVVCFLPEITEVLLQDTSDVVPGVLIWLLFLLLVMYSLYVLVRSKRSPCEDLLPVVDNGEIINKSSSQRKYQKNNDRIVSLDIFRGFSVMLMLFVNSGGGGYWYFNHSVWDGLTFADLPHSWFNWIMGMSIALSAYIDRQKGTSTRERISRIILRVAKMIILGLIVSAVCFTSEPTIIPTMGVLQDLAILYLVVALLEIFLPCRYLMITGSKFKEKNWSILYDITLFWDRCLIMLISLLIHTGILFFLDVPGCGRGYLGPGGAHLYGRFSNCTGGAAAYIDKAILGRHMMFFLPFSDVYNTMDLHDAYGPVSLLSQFVQVYLGTMAGHILLLYRRNWKLVAYKWIILGVTMISIAWFMCNDITNICLMPLNRQLWSLNFILLTSGIAFLLMTALYFLIDVVKIWKGIPFSYPGANSVLLFVGQVIMKNIFPFGWPPKQTHMHHLFLSAWQTTLWLGISILLHRHNLFLRL